jgi:hypothetical protein
MYDLAYQAKTDPLRLHNFKTISENIINIRNNNIFLANEITIEVFSEPYFANILQTMNPSAGESRDIVRLKFTTDFGILRNLVKTPQSQKQVFVYYYINELS